MFLCLHACGFLCLCVVVCVCVCWRSVCHFCVSVCVCVNEFAGVWVWVCWFAGVLAFVCVCVCVECMHAMHCVMYVCVLFFLLGRMCCVYARCLPCCAVCAVCVCVSVRWCACVSLCICVSVFSFVSLYLLHLSLSPSLSLSLFAHVYVVDHQREILGFAWFNINHISLLHFAKGCQDFSFLPNGFSVLNL